MKTLAAALVTCVLATSCADIECSINSECGAHARCEMNRCIRECAEDRDCEDGFTCNLNGLCVERPKQTSDRPEPRDNFTPADRGTADVAADARSDTGTDAGTTVDAGTDLGTDAGTAETDAGTDTGTDANVENWPDATADAGFDSGFDVGFDVGRDVGFDAGFDVGFDAGFPDRGTDVPVDTGAPDTGPPDTGPRDTGAPDVPVVTGPAPIGAYEYTAVRPDALSAPVAVGWHPGGAYALILSYSNGVFRYDVSTRAVTRVGTTANDVYWRDVTFTRDGARALLLANTGSGTSVRGRIFIWDHASGMLAERTTEAWTMGRYESLRWSPDGSRAMLLGQGTNAFYIWRYTADGTRTGTPMARGVVASTGCNDLAWVRDGFGDPALAVVCGTNTGEIISVTGIDATPMFMTAASSGQTGNVHRIAGRPQGDGALAIGSSSSKLYRLRNAVWSVGFSSPFLPFSFNVTYSSDGARALAYGGFGRVHEYRYDLYASADITDVSIGGLDMAPYVQPSGTVLNAIGWRPGCHAGLAVGGRNNVSGTTAFVAYFRVLNGVRCADDP